MSVQVILEQNAGAWHPASMEALVAGQELAGALHESLTAAVIGKKVDALAAEAAAKDLDRVYTLDHELLEIYTPDAYAAAVESLVRETKPYFVLFPHTYRVRDFAPKLAARFRRPLITDVTGFKTDGKKPAFVRQLFQGKLSADVTVASEGLVLVTVQAGAFRADELRDGSAELVEFGLSLHPGMIRTSAGEAFRESEGTVDLSSSERIVAVGRGLRDEQDLELIEKLAAALGAEVAASRPVCDNAWLPMERQVGSSGQNVAPKLYVAVGISGAIQHLVGMKGSKTIVAINKDPAAPIFEVADYGIAGDLYEVVPALIEALQ